MKSTHYRCVICDKWKPVKNCVFIPIWRTKKAAGKSSEAWGTCRGCARKQLPHETGYAHMLRVRRMEYK